MDFAEGILRVVCEDHLESKNFHRIDRLRALSGLDTETFDRTLSELAEEQVVELTGGDTSEMTDSEIDGLYTLPDDSVPCVNLTWTMPVFEVLWRYRRQLVAEWVENGKKPTVLAMELSGLKDTTVNQNIQMFPFLVAEFAGNEERIEQLEAELEAVNGRENATGEDLHRENEKLKADNEHLSKVRRELTERIEQLEKSHAGLLAEIDTRDKEIEKLRSEQEAQEPKPEADQMNLFPEKESEDMAVLDTKLDIDTKLDTMQKQINTLTAQIAAMTGSPEPAKKEKDPDKPPNLKIGKWSLNPVRRGNKWFYRAFRSYPGRKSPACVYIGADTGEGNVAERLENKGFSLYD